MSRIPAPLSQELSSQPLFPRNHQSSHRGDHAFARSPSRQCINTPPYRTTVEKPIPTAAPHPPRLSTYRSARTPSNFFLTRIKETWIGFSRPARRPGCHAPQAYWPKGADPCPAPRAAAQPPHCHHWRRPPPSSSHWSVCQPAVTDPRAGGATLAR